MFVLARDGRAETSACAEVITGTYLLRGLSLLHGSRDSASDYRPARGAGSHRLQFRLERRHRHGGKSVGPAARAVADQPARLARIVRHGGSARIAGRRSARAGAPDTRL